MLARRRPNALRRGLLVALVGVLVGLLAAPLVAPPTQAEAAYSNDGTGTYEDEIFWFDWSGQTIPNSGSFTHTNTMSIDGQSVAVQCTLSNIGRDTNRATTGRALTPYTPGSWSGDYLDNLYPGTGPIGLATQNAQTALFTIACSASVGGTNLPLDGLVMADAESLSSSEMIRGTAGTGGTWRIIDRTPQGVCNTNVNATRTNQQLTLQSNGECSTGTNVVVALAEGTQSISNITLNGSGIQAVAFGVVASFDRGDAPASYGTAVHALAHPFSGGTLSNGTATNVAATGSFALGTMQQSSPRLGSLVDADRTTMVSADALGDDRSGVDDEDSVPSGFTLDVAPRQQNTYYIQCTANGSFVGAWIDFDDNGTFDSDERASGTCGAAYSGYVALTWTVPDDAVSSTASDPTFARLRIGTTAAQVANPTGFAASGEVEDHAFTMTVPQPAATNDAASTAFETARNVPVLDNDTLGGFEWNRSSVVLQSGSSWVKTLTTTQGTYAVQANGSITFTPAAGYVGTAPAVTYRVADEASRTTTATLTMTVAAPPAPSASDDTTTGVQGATQSASVLANDSAGTSTVPLRPATVRIMDGTTAVTTLTVASQGTYTVNTTTGAISFVPVPGFVGAASGVQYRVEDSRGVTATARYTPTVTRIAVDDASTGAQGVVQTIPVLTNDTPPQGVTLTASSLRLVAADGTLASERTVANQGTYRVVDGQVTFTPVAGFTGSATPVPYSVATSAGGRAQATISVTVTPVTPTANADATSGPQGLQQSVDPLANDSTGNASIAWNRSTLTLMNGSSAVTSLDVAGGTYTVSNGTLVFTPTASFVGVAPAATYRVANANGTTVTSTYQATTTAVTPTAANDVSSGVQGAVQRVAPLANDSTGNAGIGWNLDSLTLMNGSTAVTSRTIAGQGTFTIDRTDAATPRIVFTPEPGFSGTATAVTYRVANANGTQTTATYTPSVATGVSPDASTGIQGATQTLDVVANDAIDVVRSTLRLVDPTGGQLVTAVTVANVGTYRVVDGRVTFQPVAAYRGAASPLTYSVQDANGNQRRTTLAVTVTAVDPAPRPDTTTGPQGVAQSVQPLANDQPGDAAVPLVASTLTLLDGSGQPVTSLDVAAGAYALSGSTITFTPSRSFVGTATPVTYRVADANGTTATSTYTPSFAAVVPVAVGDAATGAQGLPLSVVPLANDAPGDPAVPLQPGTLTLIANGQAADQVTVAQGTYAIDRSSASAPRIVFTPNATFVGDASPVTYRVADANGTTTRATYTPTLTAVTPVATADTGSARQGSPATIDPLANDRAGDDRRPLQPSSLALVAANGTATDEVVVAGQGTYRVDRTGATPVVRFTPLPTFTGTANAATYQVQDANGTRVTSTITPTITPVTPTAANDTASARQGAPASVAVLANDAAGHPSVPLDPATLTLLTAGGQPTTSVTIDGQGTYTIDASTASAPRVVFTPLRAFRGEATSVSYRVADANGTTADARVTPTITAVTPTATDDSASMRQGGSVAVVPAANDAAGDAGVALVDGSVTLLDANGQPVQTRTISGQGTYAVSLGSDGRSVVTFTAVPTFRGVATPVPYRVSDANGTTATASIRITVDAVTPVANPDAGTARQGAVVTVDPAANDLSGHADVPLVRSTVTLLGTDGVAVDELAVAGQGTYRVDRTTASAPVLVFTPSMAFTGTATAATYRIADANGTTATSTFTPTITAVMPTADADAGTARQGAPVSVDVLDGDAPGHPDVLLVPSSLRLVGPNGLTTEVTIAGQGTYTIDRTDTARPRVVFTPLPTFVGEATPVTYSIGDANATRATATVTPTITGVMPDAADDVASARQGASASVAVLENDQPGDPDVPLDPATVTLLDGDGNPAATVTREGQGVYSVQAGAEPRVVFTPQLGFVGTPDAVTYSVADANGTRTTATVTVTIAGVAPVAIDDVATARQGAAASVDPLANDRTGHADVPLDPTTVTLVDANGTPVDRVDVDGGSYAVEGAGTDAPRIVFTPDASFSGTADAARYLVADANGTTTIASVTATIAAVTPIARPDAGTARQGAPATIDALANDDAGHPDVPLRDASLALLDGDAPVDRLETAQGVWTVDDSGDRPVLVFAPNPTFTGAATAPYRVSDANGTEARSTATASIGAVTPVATDDEGTARQGATVTLSVLENDEPGQADVPLDADTLTLLDGDAEVAERVIAGEGRWTIAGDELVFTPEPGFVGTSAVDYRVRDANGTPADATARATLERVTPIASPDSGDGRQGATVTIDALANDRAGHDDVPLRPSTLALLSGQTPVDELDVADQGTWTVDRDGERPMLVFTPLPSFSGATTAVPYRVLDANGTQATSTAIATLAAVTPGAANDTSSGRQGAAASVAVLANDWPGHPDVPLVPTTLALVGADAEGGVTIDGQGRYTLDRTNAAAPRVVFTPLPGFTGEAAGVSYTVADANGTVTTATVTPSIAAVTPTAQPDAGTARQGAPVVLDVIANDEPGLAAVPLVRSTLELVVDGAVVPSIVVDGVGTWTVDRTDADAPVVRFAPEADHVGTTEPVTYRVQDANGTAATSTATATITAVTPVAVPDVASARQGAEVACAPLDNDRAGLAEVPLVPGSLTLLDAAGAPASTVVVPEGSYAIDTVDAANPRIVFTPNPQTRGDATPVRYRVADANGTTAESTFTPTLTPVDPTASPDSGTARQGASVTIDAVANDDEGDADVPLDRTSLTLRDGDGDADVDELVTADGTWRVDRRAPEAPVLVFAPNADFVGASTVDYAVADANGTRATSTSTATITAVTPTAANDEAAGRQGAPVSVAPLANDLPGDAAVPLVPSTLRLVGAAGDGTVTIDGQGTYAIDATNADAPRIVFTPLPSFTDVADAVTYSIADANGTRATATFTPTITAVDPIAAPDAGTARQGASVTVSPLANDAAGREDVPLRPATFTLVDGTTAVDELVVPGRGTWTIDRSTADAPTVTFAPERGFAGVETIDYRVADANGTEVVSTITATIVAVTPVAADDVASARQGAPASAAVLANDDAGHADVPLVPSTLALDAADADGVVTVDDEGSYAIDRSVGDAPRIVFTPLPTFSGEATGVTYSIADANGTRATATFTPTITAVTPVAVADAGTARQGSPVSMPVLANDRAGDPAVALVPGSLELLDANGAVAATVTVDGGTYAVDRSVEGAPRVVFTPTRAFTGTADAVTYRVADANGTTATATATPTITAVTPAAADDAASARQGAPVSVDPLANDAPGHPEVALDPTTLTLVDADEQPIDELRIPGQGTYAIVDADATPRIVFTPASGFVGTADAVAYRIADANGTTTIATYAATLVAVVPVANDDAATGRQGAPVGVAPLANDVAGHADVPLVPSTLRLLTGAGAEVDVVVVDGEGSYAIDRSGTTPRIVFTPLAAFTGEATPVDYRVRDANGTPADASFTPTVEAVTPTANPDRGTARQGAPVSVAPLANDVAGHADVALDADALRLVGADDALVTEVDVDGRGTWAIDRTGTTPQVVFTPLPAFTGTVVVTYSVADANGTRTTSTVTATIEPVTPVAVADVASARQGAPASVAVLANDEIGHPQVPFVPGTLTLLDERGTAAATRTIEGQGTYSVDRSSATPRVVFTPLPAFTGEATPATYRVADANDTTTTATVTPTIGAVVPIANPDEATARQGATVTIDAVANDRAGDTDVPLDASTLTLLDGDRAVDELRTADGVWTVDRRDEDAPVLSFTPRADFVGTATVPYRVADANGTTATSTAAATLEAVTPVAADDVASARQGATASVAVLSNDAAGHADVPLDADSLTLVDGEGSPVATIEVDGVGVWSIDRANFAAPRIVLTPVAGFSGTPDAVTYRVADANGTTTTATVTATIAAVTPIAQQDSGEARQGATVTIDALANDEPGLAEVPLDADSLAIVGAGGASVDELVVPEQGTWTVDRSGQAPVLVFEPLPTFAGSSTIDYRVADANGTLTSSTATAVIAAVTPAAADDVASARQGAPASVAVLANDRAGDADVPLDPSTLALQGADAEGRVTIAEQGTYAIDRSGGTPLVVFTPLPTFSGVATPVTYSVADANGTVATATVTPTIAAVTPVAQPDAVSARQGARVSVAPLANDAAGDDDVDLDPSTLVLVGADAEGRVTIAGQGTYAIDASGDAPRIVFTPVSTHVGAATPVTYSVADANGTRTTSTFTPTSTAVAPTAADDAGTGRQGAPVAVAVLANDAAGHADVDIEPGTLTLVDAAGAAVVELVVEGQGTWTVDRSGETPRVVLTPIATFTGEADAVTYSVADANGTRTTASVVVTIDAVTPVAAPDSGSARQGASVTIDAVANDDAGHADVPLAPSTLTLLDGDTAVDELALAGEGTWRVDRSTQDAPVLVFAPLPGFVGQSSAAYRVADVNGTRASSTATATIGAVTPVAVADETTARQGATVTIDAVANDRAGDADVPLVPGTLTLLDGDSTVDELVTAQGTWSVVRSGDDAPVLRFVPQPGFVGTATVDYRVADANSTTTASTAAATFTAVTPVAVADAASARQGAQASVAPLANDRAGHPDVPLDASTLTLLDADGTPAATVAVPGGSYAIDTTGDAPRIVFTPDATFVGTADAVTYRVADANGTTTDATVAATITGVSPVAVADAGTARQGAPVTVSPLANDTAGLEDVPLDASTLVLLDADGEAVDELDVPGIGTWTITAGDAPTVTFAPDPSYAGDATVRYEVRDANGTATRATITASITPVAPTATTDAADTFQGEPVRIDVLANDAAGHPDVAIVAGSLTLLDGDGRPVDTLFVSGEGTWRVERTRDAPTIVFDPAAAFRGDATPVDYRIADANGMTATAEIAVAVAAVAPIAVDDVAAARQGAPVSIAPLANDAAGRAEVPLVPSTLTLLDAAGVPVDVRVVAGEGSYAIDRTGDAPVIVFTPEATFTGAATGVAYRVADANGTTAEATFTPTSTPVTPVAVDDEASARQGAPASVAVLANDAAGHADVPLDPSTLTLVDAAGEPVAELVVADQGTWTIDRSGASPRVVFTPLPTFVGETDAVTYEVADDNGTLVSATVVATLMAVTPVARDDAGSARQGSPVTVAPLANDAAGAPGVELDASTLGLLDGSGAPVAELEVPNVGRWTIDDSGETTVVVLTPVAGFTGDASVAYRVADANGTTARATIVATVTPVTPTAADDRADALQGATTTVPVLANDAAGHPTVPLVPGSLTFVDASGAAVPELVVPTVGTWTIDDSGETPVLSFAPEPGFVGTATADYRVADANGTTTIATASVVVAAVTPTATDDSGTARQGAEVRVDVLANDAAGHPSVPLAPGTLTLVVDGAPVAAIDVEGEGRWTIDRSGTVPVVVFAPLLAFAGTATPVAYRVEDANGTAASATVGATIGAVTPGTTPDLGTGRQGAPIEVDVLANDASGHPDVPLDPSTLTLVDADGNPVAQLVVDGVGTWTVDRSGDVPVVVLTPIPTYAGTTPAVGYRVEDANGVGATGTVRADVAAVTPVATDDASTGAERAEQSVDPLANDEAGHPDVPLRPATLTLRDADGASVTTVTVPGQGTYALVDGRIVFTPVDGFTGAATPVTYAVADANGTVVTGSYAPVVEPDDIVEDLDETAPAGSPVTVDPGERVPGLSPASVRLVDANGARVLRLLVAGQGTWVCDPRTGRITFTPIEGFTGDPTPVHWIGETDAGATAEGDIAIEYLAPIVEDIETRAPAGSPVTVDPREHVPSLDPSSVRIVDGSGARVTRLVVPGEGVWTVDAVTGLITFTPEEGFVGDPMPIRWIGSTSSGAEAEGEVVIEFEQPTEPSEPGPSEPGPSEPGTPGPSEPGASDPGTAEPGTPAPSDEVGAGGDEADEPGSDLPRTGAAVATWLLVLALLTIAAGSVVGRVRRREP